MATSSYLTDRELVCHSPFHPQAGPAILCLLRSDLVQVLFKRKTACDKEVERLTSDLRITEAMESKTMIVLNFTHPLAAALLDRIEALAGR